MLKTECSKCKTEMPVMTAEKRGIFSHVKMTITGYRCGSCGHWNDLKNRKWFKDQKNALPKEK